MASKGWIIAVGVVAAGAAAFAAVQTVRLQEASREARLRAEYCHVYASRVSFAASAVRRLETSQEQVAISSAIQHVEMIERDTMAEASLNLCAASGPTLPFTKEATDCWFYKKDPKCLATELFKLEERLQSWVRR